ncbi:hypothetical protein BsWGS_09281 [Bradybaena similaris]
MQSLARRPRIWLKITVAWILSLIFPLPQLFIFVQYNSGLKPDGSPRRMCGSRGYTAAWQRKVYFTYTTLYILVIPMLIMLYCYAKIIRVVWVRAEHETRRRSSCLVARLADPSALGRAADRTSDTSTERCSSQENSDAGCGCDGTVKKTNSRSSKTVRWSRKVMESHRVVKSASDKDNDRDVPRQDLSAGSPRMSVRRSLVTASKRRALVMTLTVVISFLVCHTPYFLLTLLRIYSDYQLKLERAMFLSEFLVMVHSTLNPLLYGLFTLRQYHLKLIVSFLTCSPHPQQHHGHHLRQYSHDRTKLLTNVRSKLSNINNSGATTTTTTTFISNCNSTHTDPLLRPQQTGRTRHLSTDHPSTNHRPTNHPPTNHSPTNHRPTNHPPTNHSPTNHLPTNHPPTNHSPTNHASATAPSSTLLERKLSKPKCHCADHTHTSHCIHHTPMYHCTNNTSTSHCTDNTHTYHCKDKIPTSHCTNNTPTSHCINNTPTSHCTNNTPTSHCTNNTPTSHCTNHAPLSHCTDHTSMSHCINHATMSHCRDHTSISHCTDHTPMSHSTDHTPMSHCTDHTSMSHCTNDTPVSHCTNDTPMSHCTHNTPMSHFTDQLKTYSQILCQDLFSNEETSCLKDQDMTTPTNNDRSGFEPSVSGCPDLSPSHSFIHNSRLLTDNGPAWPSSASVAPARQLRAQCASDNVVSSHLFDTNDKGLQTVQVPRPTQLQDTWGEGFARD